MNPIKYGYQNNKDCFGYNNIQSNNRFSLVKEDKIVYYDHKAKKNILKYLKDLKDKKNIMMSIDKKTITMKDF